VNQLRTYTRSHPLHCRPHTHAHIIEISCKYMRRVSHSISWWTLFFWGETLLQTHHGHNRGYVFRTHTRLQRRRRRQGGDGGHTHSTHPTVCSYGCWPLTGRRGVGVSLLRLSRRTCAVMVWCTHSHAHTRDMTNTILLQIHCNTKAEGKPARKEGARVIFIMCIQYIIYFLMIPYDNNIYSDII